MSEKCPLSEGSAPGHYMGGDIPAVCFRTCYGLWDAVIRSSGGEYEPYPEYDIEESECAHHQVQHSHDGLQATKVASAFRLYTTVDACIACETEIGETIYEFNCPNV